MQANLTELRWSLVANKNSQVSQQVAGTWPPLAEQLTTHTVSPNKDGPGWTPANIAPGRRIKERAGAWCVLPLDIEAKPEQIVAGRFAPSLQYAADTVRMWGMAGALATSHSHEAPANNGTLGPRYRIILPVSRPIEAHEIEPLALLVAEKLGLTEWLDKGNFDPPRLFYMPRVPAERAHQAERAIIDGEPLDVDSLLEQAAAITPARHVAQPALTPESALISLRVPISDQEMSDLRNATMYLARVGHGNDYGDWQTTGAALHSEAHWGREPELLALWLEYSKACGGYKSDADVLRKWREVGGEKSSKAAIFSKATELGWINPARGRKQVGETTPVVPNTTRYKLVSGKELRESPPTEWCIRSVFPASGVVALYGPSGSGKSFLAFDMAAAIAEGEPWFDCRVKAAPVVYVPLEGAAGFKRRSEAWELNRGRGLPDGLRLMLQPMHLTTPQDVEDLAAVVPPGAVVFIDTLNRASPGSDENSSKDMGMILEAVNRLQSLTGGLVVLIHHTGKDAERGMRGHSSMFAAMDAVVEVKRDKLNPELREWSVAKSKDDEDGKSRGFKLVTVPLGNDDYGDTVTSCVIEPTASFAERPKLSPAEQLVLDALLKVDGQGTTRDQLRAGVFLAMGGKSKSTKRQAFKRAIDKLLSTGVVSESSGQVLSASTLFNAA